MTATIELAFDPKTLLDLYHAPASALRSVMATRPAPSLDDLAGWEFNGHNVGVVPGLLGIRKFRKGFFHGAPRAGGPEPFIQGYNIPVKQNGVGAPHYAKPSDESPKRFGFYRCYPAHLDPRHRRFPQALLLNYGHGGNGFSPPALLRDYLVQVRAGHSDLLLGYADISLGPVVLPFGSFFVLERCRQHTFTG